MVRSKPTAHAFILEVGIKAVSEVLIFRGVADETRIELNGLVKERREVVDELIREAAASEERCRQLTRERQRTIVDKAWPKVGSEF